MKRMLAAVFSLLLAGVIFLPGAALAASNSGQIAFGQAEVEPAYDATTGSEVFLLLPDHAATQATAAWSPLYLTMYPTGSATGTLDCTPQNCDHVNVLDPGLVASLGLQSVYPTGTIDTKFGSFSGGLVKGHDHLIGVDADGETHSTRHVFLVLFTPQGVADGAINQEITTLAQMQAAIAAGDVLAPLDTGLIIHASVVSGATYQR